MSNPYASSNQDTDGISSADFVQHVRGLQIITGGLTVGASTVLATMLFLSRGEMDGDPDILAWVGIGMAVMTFTAHIVIPPIIVGSQLKAIGSETLKDSSTEQKYLAVFSPIRSGHIVACAMLEGAAMFNAIAYMIEHWIGNVAAAATLIVLIALKMPTVFGMQNKVTDRLREIEMR